MFDPDQSPRGRCIKISSMVRSTLYFRLSLLLLTILAIGNAFALFD